MGLILNSEKRPPSFKKLLSCLYDESLADLRLKHSGHLRGKPLERVCFLLIMLPSYMPPGPSRLSVLFSLGLSPHWIRHHAKLRSSPEVSFTV
ncbi:hypothetical protein M405DRAFT_834590 [Rhizopogon salebrosus TDB-379]|nr:hypothetical protein M405DRAFT_834590 [Rhizopogon salebrosus TDB-379]